MEQNTPIASGGPLFMRRNEPYFHVEYVTKNRRWRFH